MDMVSLSVSEFVAVTNQALENIYPKVIVEGELSSFNRWRERLVFFTIKDDVASVEGMIPLPSLGAELAEGMMVQVVAQPRLTQKGRFSLQAVAICPIGEGSIDKAFRLMEQKLRAEGLFDESRKRPIPEFPSRIALITAEGSAAQIDYIKTVTNRWPLVVIESYDTLVQGVSAPTNIVEVLAEANTGTADLIVLIRGGGSAEDLSAFNDERVVRAVASSKMPIVVGIGHERDVTLAELAADARASTPTHAAEITTPSSHQVDERLVALRNDLFDLSQTLLTAADERIKWMSEKIIHNSRIGARRSELSELETRLERQLNQIFNTNLTAIKSYSRQLSFLDPKRILSRGYSLVYDNDGQLVTSVDRLSVGQEMMVELADGQVTGKVKDVTKK